MQSWTPFLVILPQGRTIYRFKTMFYLPCARPCGRTWKRARANQRRRSRKTSSLLSLKSTWMSVSDVKSKYVAVLRTTPILPLRSQHNPSPSMTLGPSCNVFRQRTNARFTYSFPTPIRFASPHPPTFLGVVSSNSSNPFKSPITTTPHLLKRCQHFQLRQHRKHHKHHS